MAEPWSSVDLSATLKSLMKLEGLMKCSRCNKLPSEEREDNGSGIIIRTGPCGHNICSRVACSTLSSDNTKCPVPNCKAFIRDFVFDREEANRVCAMLSLKDIFCSKKNAQTETSESTETISSSSQSKSWGFMDERSATQVQTPAKGRARKSLVTTNNFDSVSSEGSEYIPPVKSSEKKKTNKENIEVNVTSGQINDKSTRARRSLVITSNFDSVSSKGSEYIPPVKSTKKKKTDKETIKVDVANDQKNDKNTPAVSQLNKSKVTAINKKNKRGETQLHCACIKLEIGRAETLIQQGADPNTRDHNGWTPLHEVAQRNHSELLRLLLDAGANPNVPGGDENYTPLHDAVEAGHVEIIKLLIERGADKDARDSSGRIPEELAQSNLVLAAMETESEITHSQLDSTISSSIDVNQPIIANPHPLILRDQGKMKLLQKWERKFKEGMINSSRSCQVKLETKDKDISQNVTHFIVEDLGSWEKTVNIDGCYSAPLYQALLMGAWILNFNWITNCLKDEQILDEEKYVLKYNSSVATEGRGSNIRDRNTIRMYRFNAKRQLPRLLDGMHIYLHGSFQDPYPNKNDMITILEKGGAKVLKREPDPENIPQHEKTFPYHSTPNGPLSKCSHYILYQEGQESGKQLVKYNMEHLKAVPVEWLFACLNNFALIDLEDFERSSAKEGKSVNESDMLINENVNTGTTNVPYNSTMPSKKKFFKSRRSLLE